MEVKFHGFSTLTLNGVVSFKQWLLHSQGTILDKVGRQQNQSDYGNKEKNPCPCQELNPSHVVHSYSLYWLTHPGFNHFKKASFIVSWISWQKKLAEMYFMRHKVMLLSYKTHENNNRILKFTNNWFSKDEDAIHILLKCSETRKWREILK
jgi:hypothetical protein